MHDRDRPVSADLVFDVAGHGLVLLRFLMALGLVETASRLLGLTPPLVGPTGTMNALLYLAAVMVVASLVMGVTDRLLGGHLTRLQSLVSRALPIGRDTRTGYAHLLRKLGPLKTRTGLTAYKLMYVLTVYFAVLIIMQLRDVSSTAAGIVAGAVAFSFIGAFLAVVFVPVAGSVVEGQLIRRRNDTSPEA